MSLTKHHLEKAALAIPMSDAIRLFRDNGTTHTVDGKKGETGNVEELVKDYFIQDDCFICNAMNSMIIGPAEIFTKGYTNGVQEKYLALNAMPAYEANAFAVGDIIYLTTADGAYTTGLWKLTKIDTGTQKYTWESYTRDFTRA